MSLAGIVAAPAIAGRAPRTVPPARAAPTPTPALRRNDARVSPSTCAAAWRIAPSVSSSSRFGRWVIRVVPPFGAAGLDRTIDQLVNRPQQAFEEVPIPVRIGKKPAGGAAWRPLPRGSELREEHEVGGVNRRRAVVQPQLEPAARAGPGVARLPAVRVVAGRHAVREALGRAGAARGHR